MAWSVGEMALKINRFADRNGGKDAGGKANGGGQAPWVLHNLVVRRGKGGFSNDWKKCFQWLEKSGRGVLGLEKVFGRF